MPSPTYDLSKAVSLLRKSDPRMARVLKHIGRCQLSLHPMPSTFSALAHSIVYQQLSGAAAATIYGRLRHALGGMSPRHVLESNEKTLRGAGLSRAKTLAIQDLADRCQRRLLPGRRALKQLDNESVIDVLTQVRGIGRWSAEMVLIFRLGRPDVLPVGDLGIRKGFAVAYGLEELPEPEALDRAGRIWAPYRSVASWYLWRAADNPPPDGTIQA